MNKDLRKVVLGEIIKNVTLELSDDILILKGMVVSLLNRLEVLEAENAALKSENADLRARLNLNSANSHKPPSSDGLTKKPALPQNKGQKTGGQIGHSGKTLKMVSTPDRIVLHHATGCPCCLRTFGAGDVSQIVQKRQVFDIPEPRLEVTEHQIGSIECCGQQYRGGFPEGVNHPVQYGSKIKALSVLLNADYKIPVEKVEQLLGDLYDCSLNESTVLAATQTCYEALAETEQEIQTQILASPTAHFDETGLRVEGKLHWVHVASTVLFTYRFVHPQRGKGALQSERSLIASFKNWAIHDCWSAYFEFQDCSHALCNAHLLRELEALKEQGTLWAIEMKHFLLHLFDLSQKATQIVPDEAQWRLQYQLICQKAEQEEPPPTFGKRGRPKNTKGRNLLNRLVEHQVGVLAFAFQPGIPFTNNQAERDIRPLKIKQKVATSFRTFKGAQSYARIQSFVSTLRKHDLNVFQSLINVFNKKKVVFTTA